MNDSQRVTWTTFAILAMFVNTVVDIFNSSYLPQTDEMYGTLGMKSAGRSSSTLFGSGGWGGGGTCIGSKGAFQQNECETRVV